MFVIIIIVIVSTTTSLVSLHCTASLNNHVAYCFSTISQRTFRLLRLTHIQISVRGTICYPVPVHLLITLCVLYVQTNISASNHRRRRLLWDPLHPSPNHAPIPPSQSVRSLIKFRFCGYFCPCPRDTQKIRRIPRDCCQKCRIWGIGKGGRTHIPGDPHRQSLNRASLCERWARRVSTSLASCSAATDCVCHGACRTQSVRCPLSDSHCCPGHCPRPSRDHWAAPPYGN